MVGIFLVPLAGGAAAVVTPAQSGCLDAPMFSVAGTSEEEARKFLVDLQKEIASGDKERVVSMVKYPIAAWVGDHDVTFRTAAKLFASYDLVFTPQLKKTIAQARVECLFTNWQGVMIHDGEVWFRPNGERGLKIVKINRPVGEE